MYLGPEEADDPNAAGRNAITGQLLHQLEHSLGLSLVAGAAAALAVLLVASHLQEADRRQAGQHSWPLCCRAAINELAVVEQGIGHLADARVTPANKARRVTMVEFVQEGLVSVLSCCAAIRQLAIVDLLGMVLRQECLITATRAT